MLVTQTGGYGITLTAASNVIYYSNSYDLEKRLQSEDRAHRIGQHKPVTYVDLIAEKTVDEKIIKALRKKLILHLKLWVIQSRNGYERTRFFILHFINCDLLRNV